MAKRVMTVLLEYDDECNASLPKRLGQALVDKTEVDGVKVIAMSREDEFARVEALEEADFQARLNGD